MKTKEDKKEIFCPSEESPTGYHLYQRTGRVSFDSFADEFKCIYCGKVIVL